MSGCLVFLSVRVKVIWRVESLKVFLILSCLTIIIMIDDSNALYFAYGNFLFISSNNVINGHTKLMINSVLMNCFSLFLKKNAISLSTDDKSHVWTEQR